MAATVSLTGSTASYPDVLPSLIHAKPTPLREEVRGTGKSKAELLQIKYRRPGRIINILLTSMSSHQRWEITPVGEKLPLEHLKVACHIGGRKVSLVFSDGFFSTVDLARVGIDTANLKLETARASWGSAVEIEDRKGKAIHIDSAVLRAQCDPQYAAELAKAIADLDRK
jgi:hypothetical protein